MATIEIFKLNPSDGKKLYNVRSAVIKAVTHVYALRYTSLDQITCIFAPDLLGARPLDSIIIRISNVFEKTDRNFTLRYKLAEKVGKCVAAYYPDRKVECYIQMFNPSQGFWTSDKTFESPCLAPFPKKLKPSPSLNLEMPAMLSSGLVAEVLGWLKNEPSAQRWLHSLLVEHGNEPIQLPSGLQAQINHKFAVRSVAGVKLRLVESYDMGQVWVCKPEHSLSRAAS